LDIASLGIEIKTDSVARANDELDKLAATGAKAESSAKGVESAWDKAREKAGLVSQAAKESNEALKAQQQELGKLLGQIDPVVAALGRLDDQEAKLRQFKGAGLLDTATFSEYQSKLDQARAAVGNVEETIRRTGNTSKQTAAALRTLPSQFSDIFVSLQAGQNPLQVFLQQGSQIKDSFGGIGPALRETGQYALGLVNPSTLGAAAVAALALAYKQGSDESSEFNKAIILTGNFAGTSVGQLASMASALDRVGGTERQAAQALAEVTAAGKFTVGQLQEIATSAVAMEDATGKAISATVAEFKRLADEPAAASAKLNEQYHYLTASVYEQITALEQQGDAAGAAQVAIDAFSEAMTSRASEINDGLGYIETAWKNIKDAASEAWDEMLGIGRPSTPEQRLEGLSQGRSINLGKLAAYGLALGPIGAATELYNQMNISDSQKTEEISKNLQEIQSRDEKAWQEALQKQLNSDAIGAQARIDQLRKSALTNAEKRQKALADLARDLAKVRAVNPNDSRLDSANVARLQADIEAKYKDPKTTSPTKAKAYQDDAATKMLLALREQQSSLETQLITEVKLTAEQKKRAEFESLIADLKEKKVLTADQKSLLANQDAIKAQLSKNVSIAEEVRLHNESIKLQERAAQIQASIDSSQEGRQDQYTRQLEAFGLGKRQQEEVRSQAEIFREYRRYQDQLTKATPKELLGSAEYKDASDEIREELQAALAENEEYYRKLDKLRGDWKNGAKEAYADYLDATKDVSSQTYSLLTDAFGGAEDALVKFVQTGKLSFSDLANSIVADLARIAARKIVADTASGLLGSLGSLGSIFGGGNGLTGAAAASSSAGASIAGYTSAFGGGRASGGDVSADKFYQVGEGNVPELLSSGGRQYLIPGDSGKVIPLGTGSAAGGNQVINISMPPMKDRREARAATAVVSRGIARAAAAGQRYN